jgi:hypothetical protein
MKALAFVLFLVATTAGAAPARFGFDTSEIRPGEARVFMVDEAVKVTLRRDGVVRRVTIERSGVMNYYTLEPVDGELKVTSRDVEQGLILGPHRIMVDGVPLEGSALRFPPPSPRGKALYYICPKDQTMLRVPHSDHDGDFKCPVDGTPMKPGSGNASPYFLLD